MKTIQELEEQEAHVQKRLGIAQKKIDILNQKLEECHKKNIPLPPDICDQKPLREAQEELKQCKIALACITHLKQIQSWKKGDKVLCYATGSHAVNRETGFRILDFALALSARAAPLKAF